METLWYFLWSMCWPIYLKLKEDKWFYLTWKLDFIVLGTPLIYCRCYTLAPKHSYLTWLWLYNSVVQVCIHIKAFHTWALNMHTMSNTWQTTSAVWLYQQTIPYAAWSSLPVTLAMPWLANYDLQLQVSLVHFCYFLVFKYALYLARKSIDNLTLNGHYCFGNLRKYWCHNITIYHAWKSSLFITYRDILCI